MAEQVEHVVFASDDVELTLSVRDAGQAGRSPILLLHGLSQQRCFWEPVVARLLSRPLAALDQRGHGDSDTPLQSDFSLTACAGDTIAALDRLGWERAVLVGHSWGASVALRAAAEHPDRVVAAALVDGGLWSPAALGPRAEVRARLTPPDLGIPEGDLWGLIRSGDLGPSWSAEIQDALRPTFVVDGNGAMSTRIGVERHLKVLDGLLDADPPADLQACARQGTPLWVAVCDPRGALTAPGSLDAGWQSAREAAVDQARAYDNVLVHRWAGAIHDVPLQWPSLVAGFVDALVDDRDGGRA